jgi:alkylation response protein AidB-like acyl-CoA dehydrogenase
LTQDQVNIQKSAREFSEGEFRDIASELDKKKAFDDRLWMKAAELGFLGVFIEEKYEGMGMSITEPDAGSDVASVSTTAVLDNDEWVINGSKEVEKVIVAK